MLAGPPETRVRGRASALNSIAETHLQNAFVLARCGSRRRIHGHPHGLRLCRRNIEGPVRKRRGGPPADSSDSFGLCPGMEIAMHETHQAQFSLNLASPAKHVPYADVFQARFPGSD
jgi:hypothetical protein